MSMIYRSFTTFFIILSISVLLQHPEIIRQKSRQFKLVNTFQKPKDILAQYALWLIYWVKPHMDSFAFVSELAKTQKAAHWLVVKRTWMTAWIGLRLSTNPIPICPTNLLIHQYIMIKMPIPAEYLTKMQ